MLNFISFYFSKEIEATWETPLKWQVLKTFTVDVMTVHAGSGGLIIEQLWQSHTRRKATEIGSQGHLQKRYESGSSHLSTVCTLVILWAFLLTRYFLDFAWNEKENCEERGKSKVFYMLFFVSHTLTVSHSNVSQLITNCEKIIYSHFLPACRYWD